MGTSLDQAFLYKDCTLLRVGDAYAVRLQDGSVRTIGDLSDYQAARFLKYAHKIEKDDQIVERCKDPATVQEVWFRCGGLRELHRHLEIMEKINGRD